jgi:hypothetical protein
MATGGCAPFSALRDGRPPEAPWEMRHPGSDAPGRDRRMASPPPELARSDEVSVVDAPRGVRTLIGPRERCPDNVVRTLRAIVVGRPESRA